MTVYTPGTPRDHRQCQRTISGIRVLIFPAKSGAEPSRRQTHKQCLCLRPKRGGHVQLGPLRTHRALLLRSGASATFPAEPQRRQGPLCDRTFLTRSFVIGPARLLSLSRHETRYVRATGPRSRHAWVPPWRPQPSRPVPGRPAKEPAAAALTPSRTRARFIGLLKSTARATQLMYRSLLAMGY